MRSFLSELLRRWGEACTVIVVDEAGIEAPRRFRVEPLRLLAWAAALLGGVLVLAVLLIALTPLRAVIPGAGAAQLRQDAQVNALRASALRDSLDAQRRHMQRIQNLVTGRTDSALGTGLSRAEPGQAISGALAEAVAEPRSAPQARPAQPPLALSRLPAEERAAPGERPTAEARLSGLQFPVMAPVDGFPTRGYDAQTGHYAVDIAVKEGTPVHSIGEGYVIFADATQEGGYAIAVQHAGGYVSVYKHNQRLLKQVGDRVRRREIVARSGNSGEVTTGPHLHVELWRDGLAQDPRHYFLGL